MKTEIEVKIKMDKGKEIVLSHSEAEELYRELEKLFSRPVFTMPYPYNPPKPCYPEPWPRPWYEWHSTSGRLELSAKTGDV